MVKVVVEGCCHGDLDEIYANVPSLAELLIICGDFEALRNSADLETMSVPRKYLKMGDFHRYYSGEKKAPVLTVFIGGNHECLLYLRELQYGGWVAPNIYYLGHYGVVWFKGLRISGISGIWNYHSFISAMSKKNAPTYALPYSDQTIKSVYHVVPKNYLKLLLSLTSDIVVSHDWPQYIWKWGNCAQLLRHKPFFRKDMDSGRLGSPLARNALGRLKPRYWFSLHLHTRFVANVKHAEECGIDEETYLKKKVDEDRSGENPVEKSGEIMLDMDEEVSGDKSTGSEVQLTLKEASNEITLDIEENLSEIKIDMDENLDRLSETKSDTNPGNANPEAAGSSEILLYLDDSVGAQQSMNNSVKRRKIAKTTHFLALDKCLPRRKFIEVLDIDPLTENPIYHDSGLYHDARSIAVNKVVEDFVSTNFSVWSSINPHDLLHLDRIKGLINELEESISREIPRIEKLDLKVPSNFQKCAPDNSQKDVSLQYWPNNQTSDYCKAFGVPLPNLDGS